MADISEEESNRVIVENVNPVKWIAGHVLNTRMSMLSVLAGKPYEHEYKNYFGKGSSSRIQDNYPTLHEIIEKLKATTAELNELLPNLSEEKLQSPAPFQTSIADPTIHGLIAFFVIHESHHIGQLSILRKLLGKGAMQMGRVTAV